MSSSPDCNAAKLRNECFSLFTLASLYQGGDLPGFTKQEQTLCPGKPNNGKSYVNYVNCDF